MPRLIYFTIGGLLLLTACREAEVPTPEPQPEPETVVSYEAYLEPVEEAVYKEDLFNGSPGFPTYWPQDQYDYRLPCFNPSDPYEIAYLRKDRDVLGECPGAVFIFSFRTGEARQVASNACYGLDWSSTGWLIYTGIDRKIWKVKANGDSLTQLTFGEGFHNNATWNPNGQYFVSNQGYMTSDGELVKEVPVSAYDWIDEHRYLCSDTEGLAAFDLRTHSFETFFPGESLLNISYFKPEEMAIYVQPTLKRWKYFLRFDLQQQRIDTLRRMYKTYAYGVGDYAHQTERAIVPLVRQDWKDSLANEIYYRQHLLVLDEEGNEMGLVQLPE